MNPKLAEPLLRTVALNLRQDSYLVKRESHDLKIRGPGANKCDDGCLSGILWHPAWGTVVASMAKHFLFPCDVVGTSPQTVMDILDCILMESNCVTRCQIGRLNYNIPVALAATTHVKEVSAVPTPKRAKAFNDANTPKLSRRWESEPQVSRTIGVDGHGHRAVSAQ